MSHQDDVTAAFHAERPRLTAIAHRMLGSRADAEDAVQEAWIRLSRSDTDVITNLPGWLTTVVSRICIDGIRSGAARRESLLAVDDGDPAFVITADEDLPEDAAVMADNVGAALLVVLETLRPDERLAFVLHDTFAVPFAEIATILERTPDAAKMLASRARRKVRGAAPPVETRRQQREVVDAFLDTSRTGDFERLLDILDPDVRWRRITARGDVVGAGADQVVDAVRRGHRANAVAARVSVDGRPGIISWSRSGKPLGIMVCSIADGRLVAITSLVDQKRLAQMDLPDAPEGDR
ncbi:sigma-70 family RNA polymerase sigma factor [Gordonia phthalatica]|uniref:RNA polymerase sigma70 factor n=1 Tax=Gordonia phthalatica TaxID=1136941 RepID=A0A0N9NFA5_9ACTN|nr:sigma-70 family RNA polymerase sigma factor [Gordonia phthalatica]ALG86368.1 RNA polymerase sigma70 factor [Gordonia phthalatica]